MSEITITVEVHPLQPVWIEDEKPYYRIYINDELLTERTWIWNLNTYIEETILVNIDSGISNSVRIECIKHHPQYLAQFGLRNLRINSWPKPDHGGHRSELSFILA